MRDQISEALRDHGADYVEIHVEEEETTTISYRGRALEDIGKGSNKVGNVRALVKGGWGFVAFNDLNGLRDKVSLAVRQARLVGQERSELAAVAPVTAVVPLHVVGCAASAKDPRGISVSDKNKLLTEYNDIIWRQGPKIQTSIIRYRDLYRKMCFASSEGSYIEQERMDVTGVFVAVAREGDNVQQAHVTLGSSQDYGIVEGVHARIEDAARRAVALLSAQPVRGGTYTVIADPELAGLFAHEAFGHLSESDSVYENPRLREVMVLGKRFGGDQLSIVDGAALPGLRGSYLYDDEGVPAAKTYLIKDGILVGRLHSRETAAKMGEQPSGNARAINCRFPPIVRMTNTYIEPRGVSFAEMIGDIKEGIYAKYAYGGETSGEMFTFAAGEAYMIHNGQITEPVRGVNLTGNVFETLMNTEAIGDDLRIHQGGGCGKGEQFPLPVSAGSPHIRIRNVVIGGE